MQSPPAEWALGIAYLAVVDLIRARGDADGDTLSEVIRDIKNRTPHGDLILAGALAAGGLIFHRHICKE